MAKKQFPLAKTTKMSPFNKFKMDPLASPKMKMNTGKPNGYKKSGFSGFGK